jgi:hypothetical protein
MFLTFVKRKGKKKYHNDDNVNILQTMKPGTKYSLSHLRGGLKGSQCCGSGTRKETNVQIPYGTVPHLQPRKEWKNSSNENVNATQCCGTRIFCQFRSGSGSRVLVTKNRKKFTAEKDFIFF